MRCNAIIQVMPRQEGCVVISQKTTHLNLQARTGDLLWKRKGTTRDVTNFSCAFEDCFNEVRSTFVLEGA